MRMGVIGGLVIWGCMLVLLTGCTMSVGIDWRGETAVENKTYTDKKK